MKEGIVMGITVVAIIVVAVLVLSYPFMLLWNYGLVAGLTFVKPVTWGQATCILLFMSIFMASSSSKSKS